MYIAPALIKFQENSWKGTGGKGRKELDCKKSENNDGENHDEDET